MHLDFRPPPTLARFMQSKALVRVVMGPVGSGKTTAMIYEILRRAAEQNKAPDGLRHTRFAIVRNTLQQIKSTVLKDIQMILGPIIRYKVSESNVTISVGDIRSEWMLIPLDSIEDQRRLLSTQLTGAFVNEWREVNPELITALIGRLGRYPSQMIGGPTWHGLMMDSNPGTMDSPWYEKLELELPGNWEFFKQPGGLSPEAENIEHLPPDYYENMMQGADSDWIEGHVHGKWMPSLSGTAVFRRSFSPDDHVAKERIKVTPNHPICIGMDLGRTPCAVITQMDWKGRLNVLREIVGDDTGLEQFLRRQLVPVISHKRYNTNPAYIVFDPAGMSKSQLSEFNAYDIIKKVGFVGMPAPTNDVKARLQAVEKFLLLRDGMLIDPSKCVMLLQAMKFQYKYKRKRSGQLEEKPEKTHPWSDLADALQYACMGVDERMRGRVMRRFDPQKITEPDITPGAWT